jgi:hypothetical protein
MQNSLKSHKNPNKTPFFFFNNNLQPLGITALSPLSPFSCLKRRPRQPFAKFAVKEKVVLFCHEMSWLSIFKKRAPAVVAGAIFVFMLSASGGRIIRPTWLGLRSLLL